MSETNMRPIGLKLVLGVALILLMASSVHHQWSSTQEKLTRQMTITEALNLNTDEGFEDIAPVEDSSVTKNRTERVDIVPEGNLWDEETIDKKDEIVVTSESERNMTQREPFDADTEENVQDDDNVGDEDLNASNDVSILALLGPNTLLGSRTENITLAEENNGDDPHYEDRNGHDPNWRATKFADALYDDEHNEESIKENDSHVGHANLSENNIADENADLKIIRNNDNKQSSMFSWFHLLKLLSFGNNPKEDDLGIIQANSDDRTVTEGKSVGSDLSQNSHLNGNASFLAVREGNHTDVIDDKINTLPELVNENSQPDVKEIIENNFQQYQSDAHTVQINHTGKELPFEVNGMDNNNYNNFDDDSQTDYKIQKDKFENETTLENKTDSSLPDTPNDLPHLGVAREDSVSSGTQDELPVLRLEDQSREHILMGAVEALKPDDSYIPQSAQHPQQQVQPLLYQQQENPVLSQLPQEYHGIFKALLPPRMLNLILSERFESSFLSQFPARLQYFIHQNIQRIDQDFDPLTNNETKFTTSGQTFTGNGPLSSTIQSMRGLKYEGDERGENVQTESFDNKGFHKSDNNDKSDNIFNGDINSVKDIDIYESADASIENNKIYTPSPNPAVYDNPRPLTEEEFALFRTLPYNTHFDAASDGSNNLVNAKNAENGDSGEAGLSSYQLRKQGTGNEDETLPCPRIAQLANSSHPVTALVAFPDAGTFWIRKMLEQLTGVETDSIYNIMAQLKMGNVASVYQMGKRIAIETHIPSDKNFERAIILIRNPFSVDARHKTFRPSSVDWQRNVLWNQTYSSWFTSTLPLHVMTFEDLVESPLTELMKLSAFLSSPEIKMSYKCAMMIALYPPRVIDDISQITGIYNDDRRRINKNIEYLIQVAQKTHPEIALRMDSYKVLSDIQSYM